MDDRWIIWMLSIVMALGTIFFFGFILPKAGADSSQPPFERIYFKRQVDNEDIGPIFHKDYDLDVANRIAAGTVILLDDGRKYLVRPWVDFTSKHWDCSGRMGHIQKSCLGGWAPGYHPIVRVN